MDKVVLDDKNVVLDDSDVFVASKTRGKEKEVIVISDSESVVKKKVKREDDAYPLESTWKNKGK